MEPKMAWLTEVTRLYDLVRDGDRTAEVEQSLTTAVDQSRKHGATWQEIGDAIGVSRQYANKRFADVR
jgi:hypothetical protein